MNIRWSPEAAADFAGIVEYIHKQNPSAADRIAHTLYDAVASLESFPHRGGRAGLMTLVKWSWRRFHSSWSIESNGMRWKSRECCTDHNAGHKRADPAKSYDSRCQVSDPLTPAR